MAGVGGQDIATTVEIEYDFLSGGIADPESFGAVGEGDVFGFEALLLSVGRIGLVKGGEHCPEDLWSALLRGANRVGRKSLELPCCGIVQEGSNHSHFNMIRVLCRTGFAAERTCESSEKAAAHCCESIGYRRGRRRSEHVLTCTKYSCGKSSFLPQGKRGLLVDHLASIAVQIAWVAYRQDEGSLRICSIMLKLIECERHERRMRWLNYLTSGQGTGRWRPSSRPRKHSSRLEGCK